MCTAALPLGGEQGLRDLLDVSVDGEMSLAWVQVQAASWYSLGKLLRVVRRREYIVFSMVEPHVDRDLIEPERPWLYQAQVVVDPTRRTLTHTFLEHLDKECPNVWPLKHLAIDFGKLGREFCEAPLRVLT